jgi:hypothetical protein
MGKKVRLDPKTAETLGLKVKTHSKHGNPKYYLNNARLDELKLIRAKGILESCGLHEVQAENVPYMWKKDKNSSVFVKNPLYVSPIQKTYFDLRDEIIEDLKKYTPKFTKIKRSNITDGHLLVVDPADIHIGKLARAFETGEEYNSNIAVKRAKDGVNGILSKSKGFNIDKILFIAGNDVLHIDTPRRTTTSGTPQDTDGMWYDNFLIAKNLYIELIEQLLTVSDVHFVYNPSNHDYTNGFFLADVIQTYFKDCKNITFDCSIAHRKYFKYGLNLIGSTHGDGAKVNDLPLLMAHESKDWTDCKHRYIYTHHIHHKQSKDYQSVCVESLRSPSASDSWHHRNGYSNNVKAVEGFIHCKDNGQIARLTHIF